jgi:thioredoxin-like negative regulator of GroEL
MTPIFEEAAEAYENSVKFVKVNTQANPQIMEQLNIRNIPTLVVFYRGEVFDVRVGVTPKPALQKMLRRVLDKHEGVGLVDKVRRLWRKG